MRVCATSARFNDETYEGVIRSADPALEPSIVGGPVEDSSAPNIRAFADAMYLGDGGDWLEIDNDEAAQDMGIQLAPGTSPLVGMTKIMLGSLDHADPRAGANYRSGTWERPSPLWF